MTELSDQLKDLAVILASDGFHERVDTLLEISDGDCAALSEATLKLTGQGAAGGPEHIAITYLTAAYKRVGPGLPRRG